jgi:hypothetical protein
MGHLLFLPPLLSQFLIIALLVALHHAVTHCNADGKLGSQIRTMASVVAAVGEAFRLHPEPPRLQNHASCAAVLLHPKTARAVGLLCNLEATPHYLRV